MSIALGIAITLASVGLGVLAIWCVFRIVVGPRLD